MLNDFSLLHYTGNYALERILMYVKANSCSKLMDGSLRHALLVDRQCGQLFYGLFHVWCWAWIWLVFILQLRGADDVPIVEYL